MLATQVLPRRGVLLRAALATLEIMLVLITAHTWAGGTLPSPWWTAAAATLVFGAGLVVLRGRAPMRLMVPALFGAQLLLHCWMAVLTPGAAMPHQHGPHLELTWQMLLAHAVGGVVTSVVWALRRRAVEVLLSWSDVGILPVPVLRRSVARYAPVLPLRRPLVVVPLRGPPGALSSCV